MEDQKKDKEEFFFEKQLDSKATGSADASRGWSAYSLALNLGYMVALPVVLFGVGGVMADKHFNSFPLFVIIGFVLAMTTALLTVYFKTKDIISGSKKLK